MTFPLRDLLSARPRTALIKTKIDNGLLYHRHFAQFTEGSMVGIKLDRSVATRVIVKVGLEDMARHFVAAGRGGAVGRSKEEYAIVLCEYTTAGRRDDAAAGAAVRGDCLFECEDEDGNAFFGKKIDGKPVVDASEWEGIRVGTCVGTRSKNKVNALYVLFDGMDKKNRYIPEDVRFERDLRGFEIEPCGSNKFVTFQLHKVKAAAACDDDDRGDSVSTFASAMTGSPKMTPEEKRKHHERVMHVNTEDMLAVDTQLALTCGGSEVRSDVKTQPNAMWHVFEREYSKMRKMPRPCVVEARQYSVVVVDKAIGEGAHNAAASEAERRVDSIRRRVAQNVEVVQGVQEDVRRLEETSRQQAAEIERIKRKLRTLVRVPCPRSVRRAKKSASNFWKTEIELEFGCYNCNRKGVVVTSEKIGQWAQLAFASVSAVAPIVALDFPGMAGSMMTLGEAMKGVWYNEDGQLLEKYRAVSRDIEARNEAGNEDVYVDEDTERMFKKKLREDAKGGDFFELYKPSEESGLEIGGWICKGAGKDESSGVAAVAGAAAVVVSKWICPPAVSSS